MGADNETLPALEPLPSGPENVDFNAILEIAEMNGVNDARDALISQGVSPEQAGRMLESAGFALPTLAQPESVTPSAVVETTAASSPGQRAEPKMQPVGVAMDLDFFNQLNSAQSQEEFNAMYDALPAVQQHVYDRSFGQKITPAWAAQKADEYFKQQDSLLAQKQAPEAKALEIAQAEKAQKTIQMSNDILSIMDRLRGYKKGEKGSEGKTPKYIGRVGTFDSFAPASLSGDRAGWYIDHKTLEDTLALAEAQANRGQGNFTETERLMLRSAATGGLNYGRDDESYSQIFEGMYDMFKNKADQQKSLLSPSKSDSSLGQQPAQAQAPAAPASAPTFQPGKIYRDAQGRPARFRGYDAQGKPTFDKVQ
jgi:hypothetical protein